MYDQVHFYVWALGAADETGEKIDRWLWWLFMNELEMIKGVK